MKLTIEVDIESLTAHAQPGEFVAKQLLAERWWTGANTGYRVKLLGASWGRQGTYVERPDETQGCLYMLIQQESGSWWLQCLDHTMHRWSGMSEMGVGRAALEHNRWIANQQTGRDEVEEGEVEIQKPCRQCQNPSLKGMHTCGKDNDDDDDDEEALPLTPKPLIAVVQEGLTHRLHHFLNTGRGGIEEIEALSQALIALKTQPLVVTNTFAMQRRG